MLLAGDLRDSIHLNDTIRVIILEFISLGIDTTLAIPKYK